MPAQAMRHQYNLNKVLNHSSGVSLILDADLYSRTVSYQFNLLVQEFSVKPPKMFPPLFTTVIVGPLLSHFE